ncbi:hypothetical protein [Streptosporangium longisporum]|uniref:Allene oxide cyclase barrel-like domain-containing protein n=1 Tax=Streptosporangium longisporum TaxID=46187 RepID=A0ABP6K6G4_9ACTN
MHSRKVIAALALAAGLVAPMALAATPAAAMVGSCRVELYDIDAGNVADRDGRDEVRFLVGGNLFPRLNANYFGMNTGDDGDPGQFEDPATIIQNTQNAVFDLRETDGPVWGQGDSLGTVTALGSTCAGLTTAGDSTIITDTLTGTEQTAYSYQVRLKMIAL